MLTLAFNIQPAKIWTGSTVYIRADGSIDPPDAPISSVDNITYTFTDNINESIVVERDNIVVDGVGYTLHGAVASGYIGIDVSYRYNITLKNIIVTEFDEGVVLDYSNNITIVNNTFSDNRDGCYGLFYSNNNTVVGNTFNCNTGFGICFGSDCNDNNVSCNIILYNDYGILINGKDNVISRNMVINCRYKGMTINGEYNLVANNNIQDTWEVGMSIGGSCNLVVNNNVSNTWVFNGIVVCGDNNVLSNNLVNRTHYGNGIYLKVAQNNILADNIITRNEYGIYTVASHNNNVSCNAILNNYFAGMYLYQSNHNLICHNNFLNTAPVCINQSSYNVWDDGYPSGGNYWSDYMGVDFYSGPYQNITGSDGIGDTPYTIDANNIDRYPLIYPWPSHDIAIINITLSNLKPSINETIQIYVTLRNKGDFIETFDVSVNYTRTIDPLIGIQSITLAPRESITLNFTWTPQSSGRYEIKVYTSEILEDINPSDNTKTTYIYVTFKGSGWWRTPHMHTCLTIF